MKKEQFFKLAEEADSNFLDGLNSIKDYADICSAAKNVWQDLLTAQKIAVTFVIKNKSLPKKKESE